MHTSCGKTALAGIHKQEITLGISTSAQALYNADVTAGLAAFVSRCWPVLAGNVLFTHLKKRIL